MRIVGEFERMRHHDQVERVLGERQPVRIGDDIRRRIVVEGPARGNAALREEWAFGQTDLQRMEAEDVRDRLVEVGLLPREHVLPEVAAEPRGERRGRVS